ncbi:Transposase [Mycetohabitans rhizoxinica HKI 454]|uniref:Transposase n=1 Tax=Mycetohabitans rhizoxinica (strain DSM 19002 / CIP 109453 / HKI 454) TaxID=882378 RepID=E5AT15_MYCRK|nr:Transposase [Mycetohabitans rhizoxinica HKI 454]
MTRAHAVEALEEAFARYEQSEIVNTNQGSQLTANAFIEAVLGRGIRVSMQSKKVGATMCCRTRVAKNYRKMSEQPRPLPSSITRINCTKLFFALN